MSEARLEVTMSDLLDRQSDMQPIDPRGLGPYTREDFPHKLRGDYARFKSAFSCELVRGLIELHPPTGWAADRANSVMTALRERERPQGRCDQRDRPHDLLEGAEVLSQWMRRLIAARHAHTTPCGRTDELMEDARDSIDGLLSAFVDLIATRWAPGVQNVGCRLPGSRAADFEVWINEEVNRCLRVLDQCRAEYLHSGGIDGESTRLQCGWGVLDFALWNVALLFKEGCKMAEGIIDVDDATSAAVKANAAKAWALLDAVQIEWVTSTQHSLENSIAPSNRWLELVHYAQFVRGVSEDLAPHLLDSLRWQK